MGKNNDTQFTIKVELAGDSKKVQQAIKDGLSKDFSAKIGADTSKLTRDINTAIKELNSSDKKVKIGIDGSNIVKDINNALKSIESDSLKKVKLGADTSNLLRDINKAITTINSGDSLKKLKLGVDVNYLQQQLNKAVRGLDTNVKLKTKLETTSRTSETKGTVTTNKTSKEEAQQYQSLFSKRAASIANLDRAYQEFGRNSKEVSAAIREFAAASKDVRQFGRDTGVLSLNKVKSDIERQLSSNLLQPFTENWLKQEYGKVLRDIKAFEEKLNPEKSFVNRRYAEEKDARLTASEMRKAESEAMRRTSYDTRLAKFTADVQKGVMKAELQAMSQTAKASGILDEAQLDRFIEKLKSYRSLIDNYSSNFYKRAGKELGIIDESHPYYKRLQDMYQKEKLQDKAWDNKPITANVEVKGAEKLEQVKQSAAGTVQQFALLRGEALKAGNALNKAVNPKDIEKANAAFNKAIDNLVNYQRATKGLTKNSEGFLIEKLAVGSIKEGTRAYEVLIKRIRDAVQAQKDLNVLTNRRPPYKEPPDPTLSGWFRNMDIGRAVSGMAYAARGELNTVQAFGTLISSLSKVNGVVSTMAKTIGGLTLAGLAVAGVINVVTSAFTQLTGVLGQVATTIYNIIRPGVELYRTRQTAELSMAAAISSRATENGKEISFDRGLQISKDLLSRVVSDAARSAFNPQELISALQGTLPLALGKGFNLEQAYELTKGVASVAKVINLMPNQVLQELRDLLQGSISARSSQVAGATGITGEALREAEAQGKLYEFITERLQAFTVALDRYSHTLAGSLDRLQETYAIAMEKVFTKFAPLTVELINKFTDSIIGYYYDRGKYLEAKAEDDSVTPVQFALRTPEEFYTENKETGEREYKQVDVQPGEYIQQFESALKDLVEFIAPVVDEIIRFVQEITGEVDPIKAVEKAIEYAIAATVVLGEILVVTFKNLIKFLDEFETPISLFISGLIKTGATVMHLGGIMFWFIDALYECVMMIVDLGGALWKVLKGDLAGAKKDMESIVSRGDRIGRNKDELTKLGDFINKNPVATNYEELFGVSLGLSGDRGGTFAKLVDAKLKEFGIDPNSKEAVNLKNILGNLVESNKNDLAQRKRALQAELEAIKRDLKEYIDKLKDLQEKNSLAYQQGFRSMDDYFKTKAQLELQEASARLNAIEKEIEKVQALDTGGDKSAEYQKERDLIRLDAERNDALRKLNKAVETQTDVTKQLLARREIMSSGSYVGTSKAGIKDALDYTTNTYNELQGSALMNSQMQLMSVGCVEAVEKAMSSFTTLGEESYDMGIRGVDALLDYFKEKGVQIVPYDQAKLAEGDIAFMGHSEDDLWHVVMYHLGQWLGNHGSGDEAITNMHDLDWYEGYYDNLFIAKVSEAGEYFKENVRQALGTVAEMPEATTTGGKEVRDAAIKALEEQWQAQKTLTDSFYNFDEAIEASAVLLENEFNKKLRRATVTLQDDKLADIYKKQNVFDKIKMVADQSAKYLDSTLKEMQRTGLARNLNFQHITMLVQDTIDHYFDDAFSSFSNVFSPARMLENLLQKATEAEKAGFTFEAQNIRDKIESFVSGFAGIIDQWISRAAEYFDMQRNIVDANSGLTNFVKEERKSQLSKGQARWNAKAYEAEVKNLDNLIAKTRERNDLDDRTKNGYITQLELLREKNSLLQRQNELLGEEKTLWQETMDAANQALEDGLYKFMTDYVNTAESVGEAFRQLAVDILSDLQKFFAKKAITDLMHVITGTPNLQYYAPQATQQTAQMTGNAVQQIVNAINPAQTAKEVADTQAERIIENQILGVDGQQLNIMQQILYYVTNMFGTLQQISASLANMQIQQQAQSISSAVYNNVGSSVPSRFTPNGKGLATGGYVSGLGTSTSDSIPAMLSNGEYVIKADSVRRYGLNFLDAVNSGHFTRMRTVLPRFADGGYVGDALQDTARGMTDFAKNLGTSVGVDNTISIALVRDEQEAIREWAKSPSGGQKFLVDFAKGNGRVFSRFNR